MKVAFYKSTRPGLPGIYNRLVRWWEPGLYSHCELVFGDGVAASSSYMDGGVRFKRIDFDPDRWDFIELPAHLEHDAYVWFAMHVGEGYDIIGNFSFLLDFLRSHTGKWFCSEAVGESLGMVEAWRLGPNGLAAALMSFNLIGSRR